MEVARFLKLTRFDSSSVCYVSPSAIEIMYSVDQEDGRHTDLVLLDGSILSVLESPDDILHKDSIAVNVLSRCASKHSRRS